MERVKDSEMKSGHFDSHRGEIMVTFYTSRVQFAMQKHTKLQDDCDLINKQQ